MQLVRGKTTVHVIVALVLVAIIATTAGCSKRIETEGSFTDEGEEVSEMTETQKPETEEQKPHYNFAEYSEEDFPLPVPEPLDGFDNGRYLSPGDAISVDLFIGTDQSDIGIRLAPSGEENGVDFVVRYQGQKEAGEWTLSVDDTLVKAEGKYYENVNLMLARGNADDQNVITWFLRNETLDISGVYVYDGLKPETNVSFDLIEPGHSNSERENFDDLTFYEAPFKLTEVEYFTAIAPTYMIRSAIQPQPPESKRHIGTTTIVYPYYDVKKKRNNTWEEVRYVVEDALNTAENSGYPVFFQVDDWNFPLWGEGKTPMKWAEWTDWPAEGEETGPICKRRWVPWDASGVSAPPPNLENPEYLEYVKEVISKGIAEPIAARLKKWAQEDKLYLFAGIAIGWESYYYDAREFPAMWTQPKQDGSKFTSEDRVRTGYAALTTRGYTKESIAAEAKEKGITAEELENQILADVVFKHQEFLARIYREYGIPRERLYTHFAPNAPQPFDYSRAYNAYCRAGFTMAPSFATAAGTTVQEMARSIVEAGGNNWAAPEFETAYGNEHLLGEEGLLTFLNFLSDSGSKNQTIWGWWLPEFWKKDAPAIKAINRWLNFERSR